MIKRYDKRAADALRPVSIKRRFTQYAPGSVLVCFGDTKVLCTACFEEKPPQWLRGRGKGWVTAEYAMLPSATQTRASRDNAQRGRAQEISRLIGRSLRAVTNLDAMGECMVVIDCDVIQADGGTRSAAITGGWVALRDAFQLSVQSGYLEQSPLIGACAAVSVGIVKGSPVLDLNYAEDAEAEVDMNIVMDGEGRIIELQGAAEGSPFARETLDQMLSLGEKGIRELLAAQKQALDYE
ncbi:MAG TPA: ribonuclease PH [Candidatus Hydrogenedentes bacterium]|nr:ribonuclease PH [Candidatus Hydrogenedentota bacterium]